MSIPQFNGKTLRFFGDSITFGVGASNNAHRWTTLFSVAEGSTEVNNGTSGMVLQNGSSLCGPAFNSSSLPTKGSNDLFLFIAYGVNDIMMNNVSMTPIGFQTSLDAAVTTAVSKGWATKDIVILTPFYFTTYTAWADQGCSGAGAGGNVTRHEQYVQAAKTVCTNRGCIPADTYTAMKNSPDPASLLAPDGVHPNDSGHAFLSGFMQNGVDYFPATVSDANNSMMLNNIFIALSR